MDVSPISKYVSSRRVKLLDVEEDCDGMSEIDGCDEGD